MPETHVAPDVERDTPYDHNKLLFPCSCLARSICHWCEQELVNEFEYESDDDAWCDWTVPVPGGNYRAHVVGHAYCAQGKIGVERA